VRRYLLPTAAVLFCAALAVGWLRSEPVWLWHGRDYRHAQRVVGAVETFRAAHHRLPTDIREADPELAKEDRVFYQRENQQSYIVWFGLSLGESYAYDSSLKRWR